MVTDLQQTTTRPATAHPLDPLSAKEVTAAVAVLRAERELPPSTRFVSVSLAEPAKAELLGSGPGAALERRSFVVLYDRATSRT
ncbi:MAG: primary-amine oxidase, partial [Pseudonocardia sp.]